MSYSMHIRMGIKLVAVIGFSLLLAACGGGGSGGSGSGSGSGSGPGTTSSASGTGAKGILIGATVKATSLDGGTEYGTATTGANGAYTLTLTNYDGTSPILLTLTAGTGATMVCDAVNGCGGSTHFGDSIALSDASPVTLHAVVPANSTGTISAAVTPWTDMAYQYILNKDGTGATSTQVAAANGMIGAILGVNPITTQPVNLDSSDAASASAGQVAYSLFNAAFANLLYKRNPTDLGAAITRLTEEFKGGALGGPSAVLQPWALAADVRNAVNNATINSKIGSNQGGSQARSVVATYPATGSLTPPSTTTAQTDLSAAKTLIGEVRTLGNSVVDLKSPADVFGTHLSTAKAIIRSNTNASFAAVGTLLTQTLAYLQTHSWTLNTPSSLTLYDSQRNSVGTATVTVSDNAGSGSKLVVSVPSFAGVGTTAPSSIDLTFTSTVPVSFLNGTSSSVTFSSVTFDVSGSVTDGDSGSTLNLSSAKLVATLNGSHTVTTSSSAGITPSDISAVSLTGAVDIKAYPAHSGGTGGLLAEFKGNASVSGVALDSTALRYSDGTSNSSHFGLQSISLDGTFTDDSGNSFTAAVSANLTNAAQFDALGYLGGSTYLYQQVNLPGDALGAGAIASSSFGISSLGYAYGSVGIGSTSTVPDSVCFNSSADCLSGDPLHLADQARAWFASHTSGYKLIGGSVFYSYSSYSSPIPVLHTTLWYALNVATSETAASLAKGTLTLTTELALSGYPDTKAALVINRTALDAGDATLTLSQSGAVKMTAALNHTSSGDTLTFTDPNGTVLTLTKTGTSPLAGTLTAADGTQVATVTQVNNAAKVTYSDGTFETLQ